MSSSDVSYYQLEIDDESGNVKIVDGSILTNHSFLRRPVVLTIVFVAVVLVSLGILVAITPHVLQVESGTGTTPIAHLLTNSEKITNANQSQQALIIGCGIIGTDNGTTRINCVTNKPTELTSTKETTKIDTSPATDRWQDSTFPPSVTTETFTTFRPEVDPCDNFYEFSCGAWRRDHPVAKNAEYNRRSQTTELTKRMSNIVEEILVSADEENDIAGWRQAKMLYRKCMKLDNDDRAEDDKVVSFLWQKLESYGGWPILYKAEEWSDEHFSVEQSVAALIRTFKRPTILNVNFNGTSENHFNDKIIISVANWLLGVDTYNIVKIAKTLRQLKGFSDLDENYATEQAVNATNLADKLNALSYTFPHYSEMRLGQLQKIINVANGTKNNVDLKILLGLVYGRPGVEISDDSNIQVDNIDVFVKMMKIVQNADRRALANILHFKMLQEMIPYITTKLQELLSLTNYATVSTKYDTEFRIKQCVELIRTQFTYALGHKYVKKEYKDASDYFGQKYEVRRMFENIKASFRQLKNASFDLDSANNNSHFCLGLPDWITNGDRVQKEYEGLHIMNTTYLEQMIALTEWSPEKKLAGFGVTKIYDGCEWDPSDLFGTAAFNIIQKLQIYIADGLLREPYFSLALQNTAQNYGGLGRTLGHELVHGLARFGWENQGILTTMPAECLIEQYDGFGEDGMNNDTKFIDGKQTMDENFADNGGIKLAFHAYKKENSLVKAARKQNGEQMKSADEITDAQAFFLSFAQTQCESFDSMGPAVVYRYDEHSPGSLRVLGTLQNSEEFATAWNCPAGSKMNPYPKEHFKCKLF